MSESRLKHRDNEEHSSRIVEYSLTAGPLKSQPSSSGGTLRFSMVTPIPLFSAISMDAAYNNSQTSQLLRSFIIVNLQTSSIFAAEARSLNDP